MFCNKKKIIPKYVHFEHFKVFLLEGGSWNWSEENTKWDCFSSTTQKLQYVVKNGSRSDFGWEMLV